MLDMVKLATLHSVVQHGSFSAAAVALHLTQPAVSRQISALERQLDTMLVRRTPRGVQATEAGEILLGHVETLLASLQRAERDVRALAGLERGTVRLGSFFSALVHLSAELAAHLTETHPGLVIADELVDRETALHRLAQGGLDLAIVFEDDIQPVAAPDGIDMQSLFNDPLRVVLPIGHPLSTRPAIRTADLAEEVWIRPHDGSAARRLDTVLARTGIHPTVLLAGRGDEPVEVQALVAAGKGIALTHQLTVVLNPDGVVIRPLADEPGSRHVLAAAPSGPRPPATEAALMALVRIGAEHRRRLAQPVPC